MTLGRCLLSIFCSRGTSPRALSLSPKLNLSRKQADSLASLPKIREGTGKIRERQAPMGAQWLDSRGVGVAAFRVSVSSFGVLVSGFEFRVSSSGFRVPGFVFRVSGSGFRISGFGFRNPGFGFRVSGVGFWVSGLRGWLGAIPGSDRLETRRLSGSRFQVSDFGFRVSGFGFRVSGSGGDTKKRPSGDQATEKTACSSCPDSVII